MKCFHDRTLKLAMENEATLQWVIPILYELKRKLTKYETKYASEKETDIVQLCRELSKSVTNKCLSKLIWYHCAAIILDPTYKDSV